ncbi:DUF1793-domain-containing protein [Pilatotrama ljubarskyi]|nr:DUF1793-domain-containing protein [Pilatotrama ljubarskyi]
MHRLLLPISLLPLRYITCFCFWTASARSQPPVQTFFPASIPLSIRSPFMSVWLPNTNGSEPLSQVWPYFWGQQSVMGWSGSIRVDGQTYEWMGSAYTPPFAANITSVQITPTRSIFMMQAGPMDLTVTFLSPIEPSDWILQSLPFSYVSVEARSLDGESHDVQMYSGITAEWLSGDRVHSVVTWSQHTSSASTYHQVRLQSPEQDVEINHQAQDGIAYYAMAARPGITWQIDSASTTREQFHDHGFLSRTDNRAFATIGPKFTGFAIAVDLGQIQITTAPVTWAVGYVRNPSISYTGPDGVVQQLSPYFVTKYQDSIQQAVDDFTSGFTRIQQSAVALDQAIMADASKVSAHYVDLVSLAARQTMGAFDITVSTGSDGKPNASDVRIFMKDIGSSPTPSDHERVNPVERMYAALPALVYLNASLLGPMLSPLLDAQENLTHLPYAAQDLGTAYPNATSTHGAHTQGIEQSSNMLIMLYAHARFSGDGSLIGRHYKLLKRWADYLVSASLTPSQQSTTDNESNANTTNLAIKGIIGVKAMAEMSRAAGEDIDAQRYDNNAAALIGEWQSLALSSDGQHLLGMCGNQQSWSLMYNLYADRLLGTNIVDPALLKLQTAFYRNLLTSVDVAPAFGLPLDNTVGATSAAWLLFTAATVVDNAVRDSLIEHVWNRASSNLTSGAFPDQYEVGTGEILGGEASPALGAMFSLLALNMPNQTILVPLVDGSAPGGHTMPASPGSSGRRQAPLPVVVGSVLGGVLLIASVAAGAFLYLRRRRHCALTGLRSDAVPYIIDSGTRGSSPRSSPPPSLMSTIDIRALSEGDPSQSTLAVCSNPSLPSSSAGRGLRPVASPPELSEKNALLDRLLRGPPSHASTSSNTRGSSARSEVRAVPARRAASASAGRKNGSSDPPGEVAGLQKAVESLRREVLNLQADRLDLPPGYSTQ